MASICAFSVAFVLCVTVVIAQDTSFTSAGFTSAVFLVMELRINGFMNGPVGYLYLDECSQKIGIQIVKFAGRTLSLRYGNRSCRLFTGQNAGILDGRLIKYSFSPIIEIDRLAIAAEAIEKLIGQPVALQYMEVSSIAVPDERPQVSNVSNIFVHEEEGSPKLTVSFDYMPLYTITGDDPDEELRLLFQNTAGTAVYGTSFSELTAPFSSISVGGEGMTTEIVVGLTQPMNWFDEVFGEVGSLEISFFTPEAIAPLQFEETAEVAEISAITVEVYQKPPPVLLPVFGKIHEGSEDEDVPAPEPDGATGELTMLFENIIMGATVEAPVEGAGQTTVEASLQEMDTLEWLDLVPQGISTVVIDPGHGGEDVGCRSQHYDLLEKNLNLAFAHRLQKLCYGSRVKIILSRDGDFSLSPEQRKDTANRAGADLFISLHTDSVLSEQMRGVHVYYYHLPDPSISGNLRQGAVSTVKRGMNTLLPEDLGLEKSFKVESKTDRQKRLGRALSKSIREKLGWKEHGCTGRRLLVLDGLLMPGVLVEVGYISSPEDAADIKREDSWNMVAEGILIGIVRYLAGSR